MTENTAPISDERLAGIEAREKAVTPGPWLSNSYCQILAAVPPDHRFNEITEEEGRVSMMGTGCAIIAYLSNYIDDREHGDEIFDPERKANRDFILESRQDVPDLTREVRRQRERIAALEGALRRCSSYMFDSPFADGYGEHPVCKIAGEVLPDPAGARGSEAT